MAILQPDFSKIFASGAAIGELLNWPDESYLRGWGYLKESEPPPMEFFNALANLSDTKDNYLFQAINIRKNKTQYHIDDIATTPNLTSKYQLICIQEGVTAEAEPTWPDTDGEEVIDGACKWRITSRAANEVTVSEEEPINARDQAVWLALNANNDIAKLKYRTPQKTWKQLLLENKLSAILDSPIKSLERSTTYKKNDILSDATLKGGFLVCVTAGTTGTSIPSGLASATEGASITDGTAVFSVHYFANLASLISPEFSGTPTAPTAAKTANNTQIATTAFVHLLAGASNNGGIVDSLLAQNGYVKFANGLILQWGKHTKPVTRYITLPIAFNDTGYIVVASDTVASSYKSVSIVGASAYSTTQIEVIKSSGNTTTVGEASWINWIAFGK